MFIEDQTMRVTVRTGNVIKNSGSALFMIFKSVCNDGKVNRHLRRHRIRVNPLHLQATSR